MEYKAVGNRCAVALQDLCLPLARDEILAILKRKGFIALEVDIIALAYEYLKTSKYRRGARLYEAPEVFDCSSLIKWLYGQRGVWLPRRSIQQRELGEIVPPDELIAGDVVFTSGRIDYYLNDPATGVGHVGLYVGAETIIHAANKKLNLVASPLAQFIGNSQFRGARRYIPGGTEVITFQTPFGREVESADDIKWIILQSLA